MTSIASASTSHTVKELAQKTTKANKDHQYALKVYSERLESELEILEKLLVRISCVKLFFLTLNDLNREQQIYQNTKTSLK